MIDDWLKCKPELHKDLVVMKQCKNNFFKKITEQFRIGWDTKNI